jgi:subtilisin family serine protease
MHMASIVGLTELMRLTAGSPTVRIGLIDGPVDLTHPALTEGTLLTIGSVLACVNPSDAGQAHGTFVAGMLSSSRAAHPAGLCPGCTLLVRPIFCNSPEEPDFLPIASAAALAAAVIDCIVEGARVINLSLALGSNSTRREEIEIEDALDHATRRGVIVIAAAGNQGTLTASVVTRHPGVIPVVALNRFGRPAEMSNLGVSLGRRGLCAPGEDIPGLGTGLGRHPTVVTGTSVSAPFVTATTALLWSLFPQASAAQLQLALTHSDGMGRRSVTPPPLNARAAYESLHGQHERRARQQPAGSAMTEHAGSR